VGEGGRLFAGPDVDKLLARPYREDVPMACTGRCLWAAHPGGWAFPEGSAHYYLITPRGLGFEVAMVTQPGEIIQREGVAHPSHVSLAGSGGPIEISGEKWITADDVLAVRLRLLNTGETAAGVRMEVSLPVTKPAVDGEQVTWTLPHAGLTLLVRGRFPGFTFPQPPTTASILYSREGENAVAVVGCDGPDHKSAASGGQVLGSNWCDIGGDNAEWPFTIEQPIENAQVSIRYARGMSGDADMAVGLPGRRRLERRAFPSTGGWGDKESDFAVQTFHVGRLEPGEIRVRLMSLVANSNINVDVIYVHPAGTEIPLAYKGQTTAARSLTIGPGASETVLLFLAAGTREAEVNAALDRVVQSEDALRDQIDAYNAWLLNNVPAFRGEDALTRQYWHRATSILKKNLFRVGEGRLANWSISEGRWASTWYANTISYGAGHQIREARWLRDAQYVRGFISAWCENAKSNGVFPNFIQPNVIGPGQYTDWITSAVWDAHCVHPDEELLRAWAPALKRNVDGWLAAYDKDNDGLLLVDSHWWTGMEWQPSFFYFNGYDKDQQKQHLERVDLTAYVYGNARNLARILEVTGDTEGAKRYAEVASKIRGAIAASMWDEATEFFYSIEPNTHEKAMVKEVIGVYPFYFSMFSPEDGTAYTAAWKSILDPKQFWTTWPVASASKQCPAYSQDVTFNGKQVGGCMWNGPTWPHANSIVMSAMAATLREFPDSPLKVSDLNALFRSFTTAQFHRGDTNFPWTGEYYNGDTAEWRTAERDYNHSTWIDVLIADIIGLRPRQDGVIEVRPLLGPDAAAFLLDGVRCNNRDVTIAWTPPQGTGETPDGLRGLRVYTDGTLVHHNPAAAAPVTLNPANPTA
jgi:hypothetical protein